MQNRRLPDQTFRRRGRAISFQRPAFGSVATRVPSGRNPDVSSLPARCKPYTANGPG